MSTVLTLHKLHFTYGSFYDWEIISFDSDSDSELSLDEKDVFNTANHHFLFIGILKGFLFHFYVSLKTGHFLID